MYRIIDKETNLFKRDDFTFDDTEIGLDVEPSQGLYKPKWVEPTDTEFGHWVEGATQEEIESMVVGE